MLTNTNQQGSVNVAAETLPNGRNQIQQQLQFNVGRFVSEVIRKEELSIDRTVPIELTDASVGVITNYLNQPTDNMRVFAAMGVLVVERDENEQKVKYYPGAVLSENGDPISNDSKHVGHTQCAGNEAFIERAGVSSLGVDLTKRNTTNAPSSVEIGVNKIMQNLERQVVDQAEKLVERGQPIVRAKARYRLTAPGTISTVNPESAQATIIESQFLRIGAVTVSKCRPQIVSPSGLRTELYVVGRCNQSTEVTSNAAI
jgi:hypothetical protein